MNIPKSYEALAADLASEKIISKTLQGQKESYMMLADGRKFDLDALQQRLTGAEQRADRMDELLMTAKPLIPKGKFGSKTYQWHLEVSDALKPVADAKSSPPCPNCKVCMGSPDFPENCLINGVKP